MWSVPVESGSGDRFVQQYLLLQVRNSTDPMRQQEVDCFARVLGCETRQITVHDLLSSVPSLSQLASADVVLLGGSGDYSVAEGGDWLPPVLEAMRELCVLRKPTFASCWGFQAMAKALGGEVVTDHSRAELGCVEVFLTDEGRRDPLFAPLGDRFLAAMGHQDCVVKLPPEAIRLAFSAKVTNQAFCLPGMPIYCTQFHPELDRQGLIERVYAYPRYVESIAKEPLETFAARCQETPECNALLGRFTKSLKAPLD